MQKEFITPKNFENVIVTIESGFVSFKFVSDQRKDGCFYDFNIDDWGRFYKNHMVGKAWFTQGMFDFINSNV